MPLGTILAILVAVLLNQKIRGLNLYKTAFFIPVVVSYTSIAMVWQWLYNDDFGLINSGLNSIGLPSVPWLTSSAWAMPSVIIMSIWKSLGFNSVILLAGVQGVSPAIYEAADIDGANVVQKFFRITLPMLKPTVMFVMIISMINSFQAFDQIYIMTKGGPGTATQVVSYLVYMNAFQYFKQGLCFCHGLYPVHHYFRGQHYPAEGQRKEQPVRGGGQEWNKPQYAKAREKDRFPRAHPCGADPLLPHHADPIFVDDFQLPKEHGRAVCCASLLDSPKDVAWENYVYMFEQAPWVTYFVNTAVITVVTILGAS